MQNRTASDDPNIDTIVPIGCVGAGKSTFCNLIGLTDIQEEIPMNFED